MKEQLAELGGGAHALAMQILGSPEDAADAVHDAFASVLAKPGSFDRNRGALEPWFLRVVRNRCLDLLRRRRPTADVVDQLADSRPDPEASLEQERRATRLRVALASLPAEKREILVLRDYLDLSYAGIAEVLGIKVGTVMSRLHRARLALREELERDGS